MLSLLIIILQRLVLHQKIKVLFGGIEPGTP